MTVQKRIFSGITAAILAFGAADLAWAQQDNNWLTRLFQQPPASALPGSCNSSATTGWRGQSGASGNPLMTADAIRAAWAPDPACDPQLPSFHRRNTGWLCVERAARSLATALKVR